MHESAYSYSTDEQRGYVFLLKAWGAFLRKKEESGAFTMMSTDLSNIFSLLIVSDGTDEVVPVHSPSSWYFFFSFLKYKTHFIGMNSLPNKTF